MKDIVGRAELKLAEAAQAFRYDFRGKVVLDIGSSTGGFTEYALRQGAKKVIAIEKGTNQMKAPLRFDPRIVLLEKTDIFSVTNKAAASRDTTQPAEKLTTIAKQPTKLSLETNSAPVLIESVDTILADVSFVSLTKVLAYAKKWLASSQTDFLVMLKPQFEAKPSQLVNGVVKNERMRREIVQTFERWLVRNGFFIMNKRDNETVGKVGGNRERFYYLKLAKNVRKNKVKS